MGEAFLKEKIKGFPIEKYLDKQKDIKVIRRKSYAIIRNAFSNS